MTSAANEQRVSYRIREMTPEDLDTVIAMEREIFTDPWPRSSFTEAFEDRKWGALIAESGTETVGYAFYLIVDVEAHLTNIAVAVRHRRKSVARALLERIFTIANSRKCEFLLLEVRPSNQGAIAFYKKHGFRLLYKRPNYYRRPVEDALVMVRYFD